MAISPVALYTSIDRSLQQPEAAPHLYRQYVLKKPIPDGLLNSDHSLNWKFDVIANLPQLDLVSKISACFCAYGPWRTLQILSPINFGPIFHTKGSPPLPLIAEIETFSRTLSEWTDGVVMALSLHPMDVLQMRLFAALERCARRTSVPSLKTVQGHLRHGFYCLNLACKTDQLFHLAGADSLLATDQKSLEAIRCSLAEQQYSEPRLADCDQAIQIVVLLRQALRYPTVFFPLLRRPLRQKKVHHTPLNEELFCIDVKKTVDWLNDFHLAFELQSSHFFKGVKEIPPRKFKEYKADYERLTQLHSALLRRLEGIKEQLIELVKGRAALAEPLLFQLYETNVKDHQALEEQAFQLSGKLSLTFPNTGWNLLVDSCLSLPYGFCQGLYQAVCNITGQSEELLQNGLETLAKLMDPRYVLLKHISLIDLMEWQVRSQYFSLPIVQQKKEQRPFRLLCDLFKELRTLRRQIASRELSMKIPTLEKVLRLEQDPDLFTSKWLFVMRDLLLLERVIPLFWRNPFGKSEENAELFFSENFAVLRLSLLNVSLDDLKGPFTIAFKISVEKREIVIWNQMKAAFERILNRLSAWQKRPNENIHGFVGEMRQFTERLEAELQAIEEQFISIEKPSDGLQQIFKRLQQLPDLFDSLFISYSQLWIKRLNEEELIIAEPKKQVLKLEQEQIRPIQVEIAAAPPLEVKPLTLKEQWQKLQVMCGQCQVGALMEPSPSQQEKAMILHHLMEDFRELVGAIETEGDRPLLLSQTYLKVAVALEQTAKLVAIALNISQEEEFWKNHSPHQAIQKIEKIINRPLALDWVAIFDQVVAISSRYLAVWDPGFSEKLADAFAAKNQEELRRHTSQLLLDGIVSCTTLLQIVLPEGAVNPVPEKNSECEKLLKPLTHKPAHENVLQVALDHVQRMQRFQTHLFVFPIHEWDHSIGSRQTILSRSLRNISASLRLCQDIRFDDSSLCVINGSAALLQASVLIEQLELGLLALLPYSIDQNHHYLMEPPLRRYGHQMIEFAQALEEACEAPEGWNQQIMKAAEWLQPFLKELYRYYRPGMAVLDQLYGLSNIRSIVVEGNLSLSEQDKLDAFFSVNEPKERLIKLDAYISAFMQSEIKQPLFHIIKLVEEGLQIFEKVSAI